MRTALTALAVLAAVGTMPAAAETWNFGGAGGVQTVGTGLTFSGLEARAFTVDTNNGSANIATTDVLNAVNGTAKVLAAQLGQYAGGLGVTTIGQGGDNGTGSPEHTMDNQLGYEFIVFKLPGSRTFSSLTLSSLSGGSGTGTGDADVTVWIGGENIADFSFFDAFFPLGDKLGAPNTTSLSGTNFQQLNLKTTDTCATGGEATNAAGTAAGCTDVVYTLDTPVVETPAPAGSDAAGTWLIIAAALTVNGSNLVDRDDDLLIASLTTENGDVTVPEPTALALFGAGAGFALWQRRRRKVA
jgi:hypothetical protein